MPCFSKICLAIAPAATLATVSRADDRPPGQGAAENGGDQQGGVGQARADAGQVAAGEGRTEGRTCEPEAFGRALEARGRGPVVVRRSEQKRGRSVVVGKPSGLGHREPPFGKRRPTFSSKASRPRRSREAAEERAVYVAEGEVCCDGEAVANGGTAEV